MKININSFLALSILVFLAINLLSKKTHAEGMNKIRESEEIEVISNPKTPELKMRIVFKEELSIGEIEGGDNYMFGSLIYFNTDEEGNFYVNDWDRKRIQKYDSQGKYLLTIGREGQGPGEFQNVWHPRFDKEKNMYVSDIVNLRISFFDKEGKFIKQIKIPSDYENIYINSKGFFICTKSKILADEAIFRYMLIYGLFNDKFNPIVEFHSETREIKSPSGRDEKSVAQSLTDSLSDDAFRPIINYGLTINDYIYFGNPEKYEIHVYSPEGKLIKTIMREYKPIKVTKKDKEHFVRTRGEGFF